MAVHESADETLLSLGDRLLRVSGPQSALRETLRLLRAGTAREPLTASGAGQGLLEELDRLGWLTSEEPRTFRGETYERQADYLALFTPDTAAAQERLLRSRVALIGVGGIGSVVTQHLVASGVGAYWLLDPDTVAGHNLNRQFVYGPQDEGAPKVEALARYVRGVRPDAEVTGVRLRVTGAADLSAALPDDLDLVVVAADGPPGLAAAVWEWAGVTRTAMSIAAVGVGSGFWGPLLDPGQGSCLDCFEQLRRTRFTAVERELEERSADPAPFSFGPGNTAIAAMLAHDILQYLCSGDCPTLERRAVLDFVRQRITHSEKSSCTCPKK
ncbi:ThiF family adenylyltransferase [Streptomyces sp. ISL-43]|uniref:HesA/MoeB/ThiF family protein n=1 Tax=Streptomyces sp. ISL-43 TaxID=2819183 RepID=UPI001BEA1F13|nr:ThiF family adenylyltransferase [Streptomyces sp. ISL-43]MBT2450995.1 ThiF family adenylyltransferase [Streptomyces sp. ISL-43]